MKYQCTEERFLKDVAKHSMEVIRNEGVNRHIRFKEAGNSCYWFDIVTWPGVLCINGDCGAYMLSRTTDMFEFFRTDSRFMEKDGLAINPQYWSEKVLAAPEGKRGVREFSEEQFNQAVKEYYDQHYEEEIECEKEELEECLEESEGVPSPDMKERHIEQKRLRDSIWEDIQNDVLGNGSVDGQVALQAAYKFTPIEGEFAFDMIDGFPSCMEYTFSFLWNCYAIAWAIQRFDEAFPLVSELANIDTVTE
jgi:hypothetical protein